VTDLQTAIGAAAADLVAAGTETSLQVAVRRHGRVVADVNAGLADPRTGALLGHENGLELVSSRRRTEMAAVTFTGMDEVMGFPSRWAFGYAPGRPGGVPTRNGSSFGMIGSNGSAAYADIDSGLAVAIMRNGPPAGLDAVTRIDQLIADHEEEHP
jgi:hypothetical protein